MQTATTFSSNDAALLIQVEALRVSIRSQREKAKRLWESAKEANEQESEGRAVQGRFTEQLVKR